MRGYRWQRRFGTKGPVSAALLRSWPLLLCLVASLLGPLLAPEDPLAQNLALSFSPPGRGQILGRDLYGRDYCSRLLHAAPASVWPSLLIVLSALLLGCAIGLLAAHYGGFWAGLCRHASHAVLALPNLVFVLSFAAFLGPSLYSLSLALVLCSWPKYAWQSRKLYQQVQNEDWLLAAEMLGLSVPQRLWRQVLPALRGELLCMAAQDVGSKLMVLAGLAFLGLAGAEGGLDWGSLLREGRAYMHQAPWLSWGPLLLIFATLLACNASAELWRQGWSAGRSGPLRRELGLGYCRLVSRCKLLRRKDTCRK